MFELLIAIAIVAGALGAVTLAIGLRGRRIDDRPLCRKCRFDLTGVYPGAADSAARCPECGAALGDARAVKHGLRRRRPIMIGSGSGLMVLALALAGGAIYAGSSGFDFNTIKPVWWLRIEATGGRIGVDGPAIAELSRRIEDGRLRDGVVDRLVDEALSAHGRRDEGVWRTQWGGLIESAYVSGRLDEESLVSYARDALRIRFGGHDRVDEDGRAFRIRRVSDDGVALLLADESADIRFLFNADGAEYSWLTVRPRILRLWIDGEPLEVQSHELVELSLSPNVMAAPQLGFSDLLAPGEYEVRAEFEVSVFLEKSRMAIAGGAQFMEEGMPPSDRPKIAEFAATVEDKFIVRHRVTP